jgi:hypothetical protein
MVNVKQGARHSAGATARIFPAQAGTQPVIPDSL